MAEVRRIRKPTAAGRHTRQAIAQAATAGITQVEYSMTVMYKHRQKGDYWIKFGGTIQPLPDETAEDAKERLVSFVVTNLEAQVREIQKS